MAGVEPGVAGPARAKAKLAEVERKLVDLAVIRDTLRQALAAGCDDLITCAGSRFCPLPCAALAQPAELRQLAKGDDRVRA